MSNDPFIHIRSSKFPILPGEQEELVNEETYGKALVQYLESKLKERSYAVPFFCCEDWGWWVEIGGQPFCLGVCVYAVPPYAESEECCVSVSPKPGRIWSWRRFRFVDASAIVTKLFEDLREIFTADADIEILGYPLEFP